MSTGRPLSERLANFRQRFKVLVGGKHSGYDELSQLDQPLMSVDSDTPGPRPAPGVAGSGAYEAAHGVPPPAAHGGQGFPGSAGYPPVAGQGYPGHGQVAGDAGQQNYVPSQVEEIQQLTALARDAAELLWEMVALNDMGAAGQEMLDKSEQLQAQLRGAIGDYSTLSSSADELSLAQALEAFEALTNTVDEYKKATTGNVPAPSPAQTQAAPAATTSVPPAAHIPPTNYSLSDNPFAPSGQQQQRVGAAKDEEPPLISFD